MVSQSARDLDLASSWHMSLADLATAAVDITT